MICTDNETRQNAIAAYPDSLDLSPCANMMNEGISRIQLEIVRVCEQK